MRTLVKTTLICCLWASYAASTIVLAQNSQPQQIATLFGGDTSATMQVDILPESKDNVLGRKAGRTIPIAIMGSPSLDVITINPRTIRLEGVGILLVGKSDKSLCKEVDLNGDGHLDLRCDVQTTGFRVDPGTYTIRFTAETHSKTTLRGEDQITIVEN